MPKTISEIDHLSYSSIHTYQMCPRSWRYRYLDQVPTKTAAALTFGSAFHNAIEAYLREEPDNRKAPARYWSEHWTAAVEKDGLENIDWRDETPESMENLGISMFASTDVQETLMEIEPLRDEARVHIEDYITLAVPGVPIPIVGYIDIITADGVPGDFKTSSRRWWSNRAEQEMQPVFYLAALNQNGYDLNPDGLFRHYVFTKTKSPTAQVLESSRGSGDLLWLLDMIESTWNAIKKGAFPMNPDTWKCSEKWCEFWPICRGRYA